MNLSELKTVIVDDSILKAMDIRKALEFNGILNIVIVSNQEKLWNEIDRGREGGEPVGLIVTDMHYPLRAGACPDEEAGFKLIERLTEENTEIPVIICSSKNYRVPEVLGSVWYNELSDLRFEFREVLKSLKSCQS